ncbi:helix-turn-helix domain-containing protein [Cerasicoccus arenae]|nr:helix-turn-helix transcriptional regulator [Cerasicoccus arenae]MBK1859369.1 helix-turn-helix transcriptional regulator [Cerasicoccus arenae]
MELATYLIENHLTPVEFARAIGVKSRSTIPRYLSGERMPTGAIVRRIETATGGKVTARDLRHTYLERQNRPRFTREIEDPTPFPWSRHEWEEDEEAEAALRTMIAEAREGDCASPPLQLAIDELGDAVTTDIEQRHFQLHGRLSDAQSLVQFANDARTKRGEPPIDYPGVRPIYVNKKKDRPYGYGRQVVQEDS